VRLINKKKLDSQRRRNSANAPTVTSYYAVSNTGSRASAPPVKRKHRFFRPSFARLTRASLTISIIIIAGYMLTLYRQSIVNTDVQLRSHEIYRDFIDTELRSSILNYSKLTLRASDISTRLKDRYGEIESVEIRVDILGKRPTFLIDTHTASLILDANGSRWYISSAGTVMDETSNLAIQDSLPVLKDSSGVLVEVGQSYLRSDDANFISVVGEVARKSGVSVRYFELTATTREIRLFTTEDPYYVKMYLEEEPLEQAGLWLAARNNIREQGSAPAEYIDIRAGEKVFWK